MSTVARLRNPDLCPPRPAPPPHTPHPPPCERSHTPTSPAWELQDDVMLGRPTRACGETQYTWGNLTISAQTTHLAGAAASYPALVPPGTGGKPHSGWMAFHFVTVSVARSDYSSSSSGSEIHSCLVLCGLAFHLPRPKLIARQARREEFICNSVC